MEELATAIEYKSSDPGLKIEALYQEALVALGHTITRELNDNGNWKITIKRQVA